MDAESSIFLLKEDRVIAYYQQPGKLPEKTNTDLVNENIRFPLVLVIGPNGEQIGVMNSQQALLKAEEFKMDLLCVAPNAKPPVCKILNYGKYRYEAQKKARENKRNQLAHMVDLKTIQLTPQIGEHDFNTKIKHAHEFLEDGDRVKLIIRFRGRQIAHMEVGEEVLNKAIQQLSDVSTVEKQPALEGPKFLCVTLASKIKK